MKRLVPFALILSVLGGVLAPVPALAGGFGFDMPVLTWPKEGAPVQGTVLGPVLGTKSPKP